MMAQFGKVYFVGGTGALQSVSGTFADEGDADVWQPAADLLEIEDGFLAQVDLPGVDAASVEAVIDGQQLHIRGIRKAICPGQSKRYIHMEVSRGEFGKIIHLPEPVSEENCRAVMKDGVLEIHLPFGQRHVFAVTQLRITRFN